MVDDAQLARIPYKDVASQKLIEVISNDFGSFVYNIIIVDSLTKEIYIIITNFVSDGYNVSNAKLRVKV